MKRWKHLAPVLSFVLLLLIVPAFCGCSFRDRSDAREVLKSELDQLKNLDAKTIQKYISYKELFPDATENSQMSNEIKEVFSLFFQKFNYKILDISIDNEKKTAEASLRLTTVDARSLAVDFATALLKTEITEAAQAKSGSLKDSSKSLESHYLLLNQLLTSEDYDSVETECTVKLVNKGSLQKQKWEIRRTRSLENDLIGGLIAYLSDPDILSPQDTLTVYLDTLKKMNLSEMSSYLGVASIMNTSDSSRNSIAEALVEQVHQIFNYVIVSENKNGYNATVTTQITTFDSDAVLSDYQSKLNDYLSSADAVIDGSQKRYEKSLDFLLESIRSNTATTTSNVDFVLVNDGDSWKLENEGNTLGNAIFGPLTDSSLGDSLDSSLAENE